MDTYLKQREKKEPEENVILNQMTVFRLLVNLNIKNLSFRLGLDFDKVRTNFNHFKRV